MRFHGMMTRSRRRRLGLPAPPVPSDQSARPRKRLRGRLSSGEWYVGSIGESIPFSSPPLQLTPVINFSGRSDWANLATELAEDIAGRLLSADVSEYIRFRAVCRPWRELTDDPRAQGGLDIRFRPHHWFQLCREAVSPSCFRLENRVTECASSSPSGCFLLQTNRHQMTSLAVSKLGNCYLE
jgi:hypothetical protein